MNEAKVASAAKLATAASSGKRTRKSVQISSSNGKMNKNVASSAKDKGKITPALAPTSEVDLLSYKGGTSEFGSGKAGGVGILSGSGTQTSRKKKRELREARLR